MASSDASVEPVGNDVAATEPTRLHLHLQDAAQPSCVVRSLPAYQQRGVADGHLQV